ncbi:MAG: helix-turn-helix domain-containing protein [Pseudomonadota bacterium]
MQAISANSPITVSMFVYDKVKLLDLTGPLQVLSDARQEDGGPAYDIRVVSNAGEPVRSDTVLSIPTEKLSQAGGVHTLIVPGGRSALSIRHSAKQRAAVCEAAANAERVCSVCLGSFILAEAGLLSGKRATTHWSECARMADEYPDIIVLPDKIFEIDGPIWTSAGVTAGIDMALALVEKDLGRKEALRIARSLVLPIKRQGGQSQYSATLRYQNDSATGKFDALLAAIDQSPSDDYSVPAMAERMHMSERNFARLFRVETGKSPAQYVEMVRVESARDALLDHSVSLKVAAAKFGFGSEENMRRAFKRNFGVTPSDMLAQFQAANK